MYVVSQSSQLFFGECYITSYWLLKLLELHCTVTIILEFHLGSSGDPASQSTTIRWKEGFDLAAKAAQRAAAAAARSGRRRPLENRTFFSWFCDNGDPSVDDVAEVIKDDMW